MSHTNSPESRDKIGAIILTRNRRKMLIECINSLQKQKKISKIILIVNGTEDDTVNYIKDNYRDKRIVLIEQENLGSAGGYSRGLVEAHKNNLDWVWLFDDDCEPTKDALDQLIVARNILLKENIKIGFLSSSLKWKDDGALPAGINMKSIFWSKYLEYSMLQLKWTVYTGLFINMRAIKEVGLPKKEFFLYVDDTDFTYRITRKYYGFLVGNSRIIHKDYIAKRKGYISLESSGKQFKGYGYFMRNSLYFSRQLAKDDLSNACIHFFGATRNILLKTLFSKKFYHAPYLFWWGIKGIFFNPKVQRLSEQKI